MTVKYSTLWLYCIGWLIGDSLGVLTGWWGSKTSFMEDGAVAFFIAGVWALETFFPMPKKAS